MYWSAVNAHRCMLEGQYGVPEPGEISDAQIRKHKRLNREQFKVEKTRSIRFIRRALIINRFCEFMGQRPAQWFHLSTGYDDPRLQKYLSTLQRSWPWNIKACSWTPGKILMSLREQSWQEFSRTQGVAIREPHLRILRLSAEEAQDINGRFARAYRRAITKLGDFHHGRTAHQ